MTAEIPHAELLDRGYLQEANRIFFHPLGLALCVRIKEDGSEIMCVVDGRADPEGMVFDSDVMATYDWGEKGLAITIEKSRRVRARMTAFGWSVQPLIGGGIDL